MIFDQTVNLPSADAHAALFLSGQTRNPRGVYVNPTTGEIWVTDTDGSRAVRYPKFNDLPGANFQPSATISEPVQTLAVAQDAFGALYVADVSSRVAIHYPGLAAINGANFVVGRALCPGVIASLFPLGNQFGTDTKSFNELPNPLPLPTELADIQLLFNGQPAPLFFVSPGQVNFLVPMSAPTSGTAELVVARKSSGQVLGSGPVMMNVVSPALFTQGSTGKGQVAALNQDNTANSSTNPASRGTVIALFGTGQGFVDGAPPDGDVPQGVVSTRIKPDVFIGTAQVDPADVQFSGLAPGLVGVWQINVKIPMTTAPGNSTPVFVRLNSVVSSVAGAVTTIAVKQ
jgi:uncharacterized protein (TIGR03437 family)